MSRTIRVKRPQMPAGHLKRGKFVPDGTPQYLSSSHQHHGSCRWCEGNRTFSGKKREPLVIQ